MRFVSIYLALMISLSMIISIDSAVADELVERSYAIAEVTQLEVTGAGDMQVSIGATESLVLVAPQAVLDQMVVDAKGTVLRIKQKGKHFWQSGTYPISYRLTVKALSAVKVSGAIKIEVLTPISAQSFDLDVAGAAELSVPSLSLVDHFGGKIAGAAKLRIHDLTAQSMELHSSGATELMVAGVTGTQSVYLSGAVNYLAENLQSERADLSLSGACGAKLSVSKSLNVKLSGASHVEYYGNPSLESKTSGASQVNRLGGSVPTQQ